MCALNMKKGDTHRQTEPVFDPYKNNLEDIMDSNIDDGLSGKNNYLRPSKPTVPALRPRKAVPLLSGLLGNSSRVTSSKKNNLRPLPTSNSLSKLPPSMVPQDPLSPLLKFNDREL